MCLFCRESLNDGRPVTVLQCGHPFHDECVGGYSNAVQRPLQECCAYKCAGPAVVAEIPDADHGEDGVGQSQTQILQMTDVLEQQARLVQEQAAEAF